MRLTLALSLAVALLGCQSNDERYPAPPGCSGTNCGSVPPGGGVDRDGGAGGQGTGGSGATADQIGTVHRIVSDDFTDTLSTAYTGPANIVAIAPSGADVASVMYGGAAGTTWEMKDIPTGLTWFQVQDTTVGGGSGVLSTFSVVDVPITGGVALPLVDLAMLQNIASGLPSVQAAGISTLAAQVILVITRDSAPYKGISVTGGAGLAKIAYDNGNGIYSDSAAATGSAGTVILFNAAGTGKATIKLTDASIATSWDVEVRTAVNAATLAYVELK